MTVGNGKPPVVYPDSGPGPQTLAKGDENFGYFGTLTASSFLTSQELSDMCGITEGSIFIAAPNWVKCMIKGVVLFIPICFVRSGVTYTDLYNKGAVYGDDTTGKYPLGAGVVQDRRITARNTLFKVRLFGRDDTDPVSQITGKIVMSSYEIGRFITGFFITPNPYTPDPAFANSFKVVSNDVFSQQLNAKSVTTMLTAASNANNSPYLYMRDQGTYEVGVNAKTVTYPYWWPVLEVEDPNKVIPAKDVTSNPNTGLIPISVSSFTYEP